MLETSKITDELKTRLIKQKYMNLPYDMKIHVLVKELKKSLGELISYREITKYSLNDIVYALDARLITYGYNRYIFCSYINSIINIVGNFQGSMITWDQSDDIKLGQVKLSYDEYGFINKITSNRNSKPSMVLLDLVNNLESKESSKLLVK